MIFHCTDSPTFFIHSSIDDNSGCFRFGVIMNDFAMSSHVQIWYRHMFSVLLSIQPGHMINLCLTFWGTAKLLSQVACNALKFHQQPMMVLTSLHPWQCLLRSILFYRSHPSEDEVLSYCDLDLLSLMKSPSTHHESLMTNDVEHYFT